MISDLSSFAHCNFIYMAFQCTPMQANSHVTKPHLLMIQNHFFVVDVLEFQQGYCALKLSIGYLTRLIDILASFCTVCKDLKRKERFHLQVKLKTQSFNLLKLIRDCVEVFSNSLNPWFSSANVWEKLALGSLFKKRISSSPAGF